MNAFQIAQQIVSALGPTNFVWTPGGEPVLSRVIVGPATPDFFQQDFVAPAAILHVETGKDDDEHPADLVEEQRFTLYLFTSNPSEMSGSAAVVGGNRDSLLSSRNRGLLELEPLVKQQLFNLTGLTARPRTTGGQPTAYAGKMGGVVAERALEIVVTRIPSLPDYAPVQRLRKKGAGSPWLFLWAPLSRYDLVGFTYVRTAGATPATSPAGGTFVPADGQATGTFTIVGTALAGYSFRFGHDGGASSITGIAGATTDIAASNLAAAINAALSAFVTAAASGSVVTVTPVGSSLALYVVEGGTPGQVTTTSGAGFGHVDGGGAFAYAFFWAFDQAIDPLTGVGGSPPGTPAPNAWSAQQSSQAGLVNLPAQITVP